MKAEGFDNIIKEALDKKSKELGFSGKKLSMEDLDVINGGKITWEQSAVLEYCARQWKAFNHSPEGFFNQCMNHWTESNMGKKPTEEELLIVSLPGVYHLFCLFTDFLCESFIRLKSFKKIL